MGSIDTCINVLNKAFTIEKLTTLKRDRRKSSLCWPRRSIWRDGERLDWHAHDCRRLVSLPPARDGPLALRPGDGRGVQCQVLHAAAILTDTLAPMKYVRMSLK
eukprot:scaffold27324_cov66-Phaeocystis_antarctica.AAC.1